MAGAAQGIDLLTPVVPRERWHPNFTRIIDFPTDQEHQVLRDWASGFVDRDGKLVIEFQTTFNSSFWELYLHALWRDAGCVVDFGAARPDFSVSGPLGSFVAESVVTSNPATGMPEWVVDLSRGPAPREDILDLAALRLTQAIREKHRKWVNEYRHLPHCSDKPFIVCVAPFEQPFASTQGTQAIDRVLFGGPEEVRYTHGGEPFPLGHAVTSAAWKPSGASVPLGLFTTPELADVSAVVFSSLATWSKVTALAGFNDDLISFESVRLFHAQGLVRCYQPSGQYTETLADGLHVFLNPHATRRFDVSPWHEYGIGVHAFDEQGTRSYIPDGCLMFRRAWRIRPRAPDEAGVMPHQPPTGSEHHTRQLPPDGVLFGGPSRVLSTDSIELMLHRGWTVYVGRDIADGDWCTMAKPGSHTSVQAFLSADPSGGFQGEFVATRDEALAQACARIDALLAAP